MEDKGELKAEAAAENLLTLYRTSDPILDTSHVQNIIQVLRSLKQPDALSRLAMIEMFRHAELRGTIPDYYMPESHEDHIIRALAEMNNEESVKALGFRVAESYPEKAIKALEQMNPANVPGTITKIAEFHFRKGLLLGNIAGLDAIVNMADGLSSATEYLLKDLKKAAKQLTNSMLQEDSVHILAGAQIVYDGEQKEIHYPNKSKPVDDLQISRLRDAFIRIDNRDLTGDKRVTPALDVIIGTSRQIGGAHQTLNGALKMYHS